MELRELNNDGKLIYYDWLYPLEAFEVLHTQWKLTLETLKRLETEGVISDELRLVILRDSLDFVKAHFSLHSLR